MHTHIQPCPFSLSIYIYGHCSLYIVHKHVYCCDCCVYTFISGVPLNKVSFKWYVSIALAIHRRPIIIQWSIYMPRSFIYVYISCFFPLLSDGAHQICRINGPYFISSFGHLQFNYLFSLVWPPLGSHSTNRWYARYVYVYGLNNKKIIQS